MAREIDQVAGGGKDLLGALRHVQSGIVERDIARPPLDQFGADLALEFAHLHGQRRLAHRAVGRCPSEMPMARERGEITQLAQGDHADKLFLSNGLINTIRPYGRRPLTSAASAHYVREQTHIRRDETWTTKPH